MNNARVLILVVMAAVVAAAVWSDFPGSLAQSPPPPASSPASPAPTTPAQTTPPVAAPAPAQTPPPPPAATPAVPAAPPAPTAETPAPVAPPATAQTPATPPAAPPPAAEAPPATTAPKSADPFGEEQTLTAKKVLMLKSSATWDSAFETIVGSLKSLSTFLDKQNIKPAGSVIIVYTSTDDNGFTYQAEIPVDQDPKNLTKGMSIGTSPEGPTLKFVHRGSYDNMDNTYEAITNYLDEKKLEAKDTFIEEYVTDPLNTTEDKLIINVFVPLK
ncbi:GyrI-like domain-containing protein [Bradyrhizobium sp. SYSU BS000235]|uniref:GyrI-like domain-containing protein n=1 Tax=Bradyrhizobium sp. SYSU BS000235 TaxID=3411332 RepID=UPI003C768BA8